MSHNTIRFHFSGGGAAFPWSVGYASVLKENFSSDNKYVFSGASSGGVVAAALALNIDLNRVIKVAYEIQQSMCRPPRGLFGTWRKALLEFYEQLLPKNINYTALDNLEICITNTNLDIKYVNQFKSREDLKEALLATKHIPFILDLKPTTRFRGEPCVDGYILGRSTSPKNPFNIHNVNVPFSWSKKDNVRPWEAVTPKSL